MATPLRIGIIGCGRISGQYLWMASRLPGLHVLACADLDVERAKAKAEEFQIARGCSVEELLADKRIELVLNLTIPAAHYPVAMQCLSAGKHVYCEKPLGISREEGRRILDEARRRNLRVGCAPDTFLGSGVQTARKLIDDGAIGRPLAFTAAMMCRGHESWHPSPEFYYQPGGGPMFDMGPYYLTALLNLLGPVKRLSAFASIALPERTITSEPLRGQTFTVHTPDHIAGTIEFENGCIGTLMTSFATMHAVIDSNQPIVIYGESGTLRVPDPNGFDGPIHLRGADDADWREVQPMFPTGYGRGIGAADMADALRSGGPIRAGGEQGMAVLDLMAGFLDSSAGGQAFIPTVQYVRPNPMPQSDHPRIDTNEHE
jgi:predicted dehydrogenase